MPVESLRNELKERKDSSGPDAGKRVRRAGEKKIEQTEADGIALSIQPSRLC